MSITKRDPKTGQILPGGKKLSSEQAAEMGSAVKGKKEKLISVDQLLKDDGYPDPEKAPERRRLMAAEAAKGNTTAIKSFSTKEEQEASSPTGSVQPGHICPTCRQYVLTDLVLTDDQIGNILDAIEYDNEIVGLGEEVRRLEAHLAGLQVQEAKYPMDWEDEADQPQDTGNDPITQ